MTITVNMNYLINRYMEAMIALVMLSALSSAHSSESTEHLLNEQLIILEGTMIQNAKCMMGNLLLAKLVISQLIMLRVPSLF